MSRSWRARFERAMHRRLDAGLGTPETATAYRLAHGGADDTEGWVVDVYDRWLVAQSYTDAPAGEPQVLDALAELPFEGVYLKRRPRQANALTERERSLRAPARALRGRDAPEALIIHEGGVPLETRLGEGLSTGLFLDQREHRARVREQARGRVLNLFAYTCGFGVMAALAGAETINVDLSKRVLEWGKRNYARSGLALPDHRFFARDAFEFLERARRRGECFDLVILDPPSYARGRRGRFNADRDYARLCASALSVTAQGGQLLACSNQQQLTEDLFRARVEQAAERAGRRVGRPRVEPLPVDFPVAPGGVPHLKACWMGRPLDASGDAV